MSVYVLNMKCPNYLISRSDDPCALISTYFSAKFIRVRFPSSAVGAGVRRLCLELQVPAIATAVETWALTDIDQIAFSRSQSSTIELFFLRVAPSTKAAMVGLRI